MATPDQDAVLPHRTGPDRPNRRLLEDREELKMPRLYAHLFTGDHCECPGCDRRSCDLYPTNGGRNIVRACSSIHAAAAWARFAGAPTLAANDQRED